MKAEIKSCSCKNDWQDKKYGKGQRVFNEKSNGSFKCTVCGAISGSPKGAKGK